MSESADRQLMSPVAKKRRIVFVQFGDFRETCQRFSQGLPETYYAQRYSVDLVCQLVNDDTDVVVFCLNSDQYDETLPNGVRTLGCRLYESTSPADVVKMLSMSELRPTDVVLRTPLGEMLRWCLSTQTRVLPIFADNFSQPGIRNWWRNHRLARSLNHDAIRWVGNHNVPATESLAAIGVKREKLVAWDWPHEVTPEQFAVRPAVSDELNPRLLFVGSVIEAKGVGDALRALTMLRMRGLQAKLEVVGGGEISAFEQLAKQLQIRPHVTFTGRVGNNVVVPKMRRSDVVLVPSHHGYAEGIPMTIYEALAARTPLVISDHPMFVARFRADHNAVICPERDAEAFAEGVRRLVEQPALYRKLSENSLATWNSLQCSTLWGDLVMRFLNGG